MIYRIDVRTTPAARDGEAAVDPVGEAVRHQIAEFGRTVGAISTRRIFLIDSDAQAEQIKTIASQLLADPVIEQAEIVSALPAEAGNGTSRIEIHLKPGVMDPVAASTEMAIRDMGLPVTEVRTGRAYLIDGHVARADLEHIAGRILANGVIESVHFDTYLPTAFARGRDYTLRLRHVDVRNLSDAQLQKLSREGHLFLSLPEMQAMQDYFRKQGREPTDVELETVAQTWSEHCVHKTLKSAVDVEVKDASGKTVGTRHYKNLIKETIFDSTMTLMGRGKSSEGRVPSSGEARSSSGLNSQPSTRDFQLQTPNSQLPTTTPDFCLSVFKDNAGVIAFDDVDAVCFKVETHNHPSAIEPYGGSATGAGGVIRDILGTGLAAKPVANTDVFCVAYPGVKTATGETYDPPAPLPKGVIHPRRVLQQVVAGVRDYGNRMGIPTVNGAVYFDNRYVGNPLVFCGCVGILPRDKIEKAARPGDAVVVMGGRTGRDGIHGATFSSAELTDTHADEFSHAVQIGNAITEKKVADVILQARDRDLFTAVTDCGAGGLSSAVGEMGEKIGAEIDLDAVPLKYVGLRYDEIWISEAQERMVLSVPREKLDELLALSAGEDVEATVIGTFGTPGEALILRYHGTEVGRLSMDFLHRGIPMPTRKATVIERGAGASPASPDPRITGFQPVSADSRITGFQPVSADSRITGFQPVSLPSAKKDPGVKTRDTNTRDRLLSRLAHPNTASKHWVIRQYDHEVQGGSVVKPLIGPLQLGPSDAAVIRPKLGSDRGVVIACGLAPHVADPYEMAIASIDEAVRNAVCVGANLDHMAILDNFCWPSVDSEQSMGDLVRTCEACRDAALAFGIPFISGKDSLHNQFTNSETGEVIRIPNTLLVSAIAVIEDVHRCVTMDLKKPGNTFALVRSRRGDSSLKALAVLHRALAATIRSGAVLSCHDVSDGGVLTAAAEMCIASGLGLDLDLSVIGPDAFAEGTGMYLLELNAADPEVPGMPELLAAAEVVVLGSVCADSRLSVGDLDVADRWAVSVDQLTEAWRGTLDW